MPAEQLKDFLHDRKGALAGERVAAQYVVRDPEARAADVSNLYGKRWGIETTFRDINSNAKVTES
ncbi:MAG: hypothetical protein ACREXW_20140, partial [Gammaproteobacteria bacterium]